ncbi:inhibitor of nuclear factor kappa-B kinase subunit alpha-like [Glandiceps talaboti]
MNGMSYQTKKAERGGWIHKSNIGSGGFGTVMLWVNEQTKENLALKQCRLNLDGKHRKRWQLEVTIMQRLDHPNIIKAIGVPDVLLPLEGELPRLAMEYCSGGDLRKSLNKPENSCGLKENVIRDAVHDIASGIEYLHSKRIIHRDLKPENIVLQPKAGKILYKIIDLGYAKELDDGSLCNSFVGTLQYLAPELFSNKEYTRTVDYWSFGNVVFECVTGVRPFLPNLPPVQWHGIIKQKRDEHICAYYTMRGETAFSDKITGPNHLCQPFKEDLEDWLRLMLLWLPRVRGGPLDADSKRPRCFSDIDRILNRKVIHIYCIHSNKLLSYVVAENITMRNLQTKIAKDSGIEIKEQEILLPTGNSADPTLPSLHLWTEPQEGGESIIFLFRKHAAQVVSSERHMPELVQCMISEPQTLMPYEEQRKTWAHALYFCGQLILSYQRQLGAQRAAMMSLLRLNSNLSKVKGQMIEDYHKVTALVDFFTTSHQVDVESYNDQAEGGVTSDKLYNSWKKMGEDVQKYTLQGQVKDLEQQAMIMQGKVMELQRSPYSRIRQSDASKDLVLIEKESHALYNSLRQKSKDQRHLFQDSTEMLTVVIKCLTRKEDLTKDLAAHLSKIMQFKSEVSLLMPKLETMLMTLGDARKDMIEMQEQRQKDIWKLVKVATRMNQPSQQPSRHTGPHMNAAPLMSEIPTRSAAEPAMSLASINMLQSIMADKSSEDSMVAIDNNAAATDRFLEAFKSLKSDSHQSLVQVRSLDWRFLEGSHTHLKNAHHGK